MWGYAMEKGVGGHLNSDAMTVAIWEAPNIKFFRI
jgi:hypothetical protein